jgi:hypothetical protein
MPREQETLLIDRRDGWVQLSDGDASHISFQVLIGEIEIRAGGTDAPANDARGWQYGRGLGERNIALTDIAATASTRLWAIANGRSAMILVDHA